MVFLQKYQQIPLVNYKNRSQAKNYRNYISINSDRIQIGILIHTTYHTYLMCKFLYNLCLFHSIISNDLLLIQKLPCLNQHGALEKPLQPVNKQLLCTLAVSRSIQVSLTGSNSFLFQHTDILQHRFKMHYIKKVQLYGMSIDYDQGCKWMVYYLTFSKFTSKLLEFW